MIFPTRLSVILKVRSHRVQRREISRRCSQVVEQEDDRWPSSGCRLLWRKEQQIFKQEAIYCRPVRPVQAVCLTVSTWYNGGGAAGALPDGFVCASAEEAARTGNWVRICLLFQTLTVRKLEFEHFTRHYLIVITVIIMNIYYYFIKIIVICCSSARGSPLGILPY